MAQKIQNKKKKSNKGTILIGFLVYLIIIVSFILFPSMGSLLSLGMRLATTITVLIILTFLYPLALMMFFVLSRSLTKKNNVFFNVQVKLAASVSVSLGLLGTFQGLIQMVSRIAQALQGTGDISERIETLLATIGSALNAMSYAFITSVLGVISSVVILLAYNFWKYGFSQDSITEPGEELEATGEKLTLANIEEQLGRIKDANLSLMDKIIAVGTDKAVLNQLIDRVDTLIIKQEIMSQDIRNLVENTLTTNQTLIKSFDVLNRAVDATAAIAPGFTQLSKDINGLTDSVGQQVAASNEVNNSISAKFAALGNELSNLGIIESHLSELKHVSKEQTQSLINSFDNVNHGLNNVFDTVSKGFSALPVIESGVTSLASRVHDYSNQLGSLDNAINKLSDQSVNQERAQAELITINKDLVNAVVQGNSTTASFAQQQLEISSKQLNEQEAYKLKVKSALEALL